MVSLLSHLSLLLLLLLLLLFVKADGMKSVCIGLTDDRA